MRNSKIAISAFTLSISFLYVTSASAVLPMPDGLRDEERGCSQNAKVPAGRSGDFRKADACKDLVRTARGAAAQYDSFTMEKAKSEREAAAVLGKIEGLNDKQAFDQQKAMLDRILGDYQRNIETMKKSAENIRGAIKKADERIGKYQARIAQIQQDRVSEDPEAGRDERLHVDPNILSAAKIELQLRKRDAEKLIEDLDKLVKAEELAKEKLVQNAQRVEAIAGRQINLEDSHREFGQAPPARPTPVGCDKPGANKDTCMPAGRTAAELKAAADWDRLDEKAAEEARIQRGKYASAAAEWDRMEEHKIPQAAAIPIDDFSKEMAPRPDDYVAKPGVVAGMGGGLDGTADSPDDVIRGGHTEPTMGGAIKPGDRGDVPEPPVAPPAIAPKTLTSAEIAARPPMTDRMLELEPGARLETVKEEEIKTVVGWQSADGAQRAQGFKVETLEKLEPWEQADLDNVYKSCRDQSPATVNCYAVMQSAMASMAKPGGIAPLRADGDFGPRSRAAYRAFATNPNSRQQFLNAMAARGVIVTGGTPGSERK